MSHDETLDGDLVSLPVDHLFQTSTTHIGFRRGMFLRGFMFDFIQRFAPHLTREVVESVAAIPDAEQRRRHVAERFPSLVQL